MRRTAVVLAVAWGLVSAGAASAQGRTPGERGMWRPASSTAIAITGDVAISETKLTIQFAAFTIAQIRDLTPAEVAAVTDGGAAGSGSLYRLSIPAAKRFLHKNTLCGSEETQWMVTVAQGRGLRVAFFSGASLPALTAEAIANTTSLCGTFGYVR